jgi:OmpA-OmpF porin, OOP family
MKQKKEHRSYWFETKKKYFVMLLTAFFLGLPCSDAQAEILEEQPMTQKMVAIKADEMFQAISLSGRVSLYGILFDTNQADIKPESGPTLDEIAVFLKQEPTLNLHVVGHTDNVGGYEYNLNLSKRRADAVVNALTKQYGISAGRLTANGLAYLAPVAVNTNEEGRAKNRRVELVPR